MSMLLHYLAPLLILTMLAVKNRCSISCRGGYVDGIAYPVPVAP